jgi:hypothetical protein
VSLACAVAAQGAGEPEYGCKGIHRGKAQVNPNPRGRPPIAIGDSTMILPIPNLDQVGYSVNARGCRGFLESISVAEKLKRKHRLPHLVLIAAYSNGGVNPDLIQSTLDVLGRPRVDPARKPIADAVNQAIGEAAAMRGAAVRVIGLVPPSPPATPTATPSTSTASRRSCANPTESI